MEILEELLPMGYTVTLRREGWATAVLIARDDREVEGLGTNIRRAAIHALMQLSELTLYASEEGEYVP